MSDSPPTETTKGDQPEAVKTPPSSPRQPASPQADPLPSSQPSAHRQERGEYTWGGYLRFLAQRVFLYSVLYVLSIGPFYWQWYGSRFVGGSAVVAAFYQPLVILAEWVPPFRDWIDWYVYLWIA